MTFGAQKFLSSFRKGAGRSGLLLLSATTLLTVTVHPAPKIKFALAEEGSADASGSVDIDAVRNELRAASAVSKGAPAASPGQVAKDGFAIVEGDLEQANANYSMAQEQLLKQLQKAKVSPSDSEGAVAVRPEAPSAPRPEAHATADIQTLTDQLDKTDAAIKALNDNISEQMASLKIEPKAERLSASKQASDIQQKKAAAALSASAALTKENARVRNELAVLQKKHQQALRDLESARNRLMVAETEVERLSTIVQVRARSDMAVAAGAPLPVKAVTNTAERPSAAAPRVSSPATRASQDRIPRPESVGSDMPIATVISDKANLRIGPSMKDSPLMSVSEGTRLTVEKRDGDWYRVIAPTGARAWVSSDVVQFGRSASLSPDTTVRVKGIKAARESDNFTLVDVDDGAK